MHVVIFARNLMFADRLVTAATAAGHAVSPFAPDEEAPAADLVVIDLNEAGWERAVEWARAQQPRPRILGFGPHVRGDLFEAARQAGVDRSVANSKLAEDPARIMAEAALPGLLPPR
ncbi:MAG: DNA-binding response regulator [Candidatus Sericytochromatia bacterium]|uniref:DNA-binding response regulator n=1 Tax=Candidatus Tanganyikabacteria bacterium TaxID=2961651 RepID=A0A937X1C2_9BACT|nr:DNA-binding response regulator [Candidatus Tanganyikabacteria bacterium]